MLVFAPIIFIAAVYFMKPIQINNTAKEFPIMMIIIVAFLQPFALPLIEKVQIKGMRKSTDKSGTAEGLYSTLVIIKCAFVEVIYMYGIVMFLVTGERTTMYYLALIAAAWTLYVWPTQAKYRKFIEKVNRP